MNRTKRIRTLLLSAAWIAAICSALVFTAVKLRNWGPELDAPEQSDFVVYHDAASVIAAEPSKLYRVKEWSDVLQRPVVSSMPFPYMPVVAVLLRPFGEMDFDAARRLWFWISLAQLAGVLLLLVRAMPARRAGLLAVALAALHPSFLDTLHLGQISGLIALLTLASWLGFGHRNRAVRFVAGVLLGMACGIKPIVIGLALVALLRRNYVYAAGGIVGGALMLGAGLLLLPVTVTQEYLQLLLGYSVSLTPPGIEAFLFWNQSVWAFWRKLFGDAYTGDRILSAVTAAGILLVTLVRQWRKRGKDVDAADAASGLLAVLICEPVTWNHYLLAAAPVFLGAAGSAKRSSVSPTSAAWIRQLLLPIGYLLTVQQRASVPLVAMTGLELLSSLALVGMLAWWAATTFSAGNPPRAAQDSGE